jgi:hypothetical protein
MPKLPPLEFVRVTSGVSPIPFGPPKKMWTAFAPGAPTATSLNPSPFKSSVAPNAVSFAVARWRIVSSQVALVFAPTRPPTTPRVRQNTTPGGSGADAVAFVASPSIVSSSIPQARSAHTSTRAAIPDPGSQRKVGRVAPATAPFGGKIGRGAGIDGSRSGASTASASPRVAPSGAGASPAAPASTASPCASAAVASAAPPVKPAVDTANSHAASEAARTTPPAPTLPREDRMVRGYHASAWRRRQHARRHQAR